MQLVVGEQQGAAEGREVEPLEGRSALERPVEEVEAVDVDVCALHPAEPSVESDAATSPGRSGKMTVGDERHLGKRHRVMENSGRNKNTPGTDAAFDLLSEIAVDPGSTERYPDGIVLIPADSPDALALLSRAIGGHRPVALVYPGVGESSPRPEAGRSHSSSIM